MNKDENGNTVLLTNGMSMTTATFWGRYNEQFRAWLKLFNKKGVSSYNADFN